MKNSSILAILGIIFGVIGAIMAFSFSVLGSDLVINSSIAFVSSFLAIVGIWIAGKDDLIAGVTYIICGISVLIGISLLGVIPLILFVIAGALAIRDGRKARSEGEIDTDLNKKYWIVPVLVLLIIIVCAVAAQSSFDSGMSEDSKSIQISDVSNNLEESYGLVSGGINGKISTTKDFDYLQMEVDYFDDSGSNIYQDTIAWNKNNVTANQNYTFNSVYAGSGSEIPKKATIKVYKDFSTDNVIYEQNVTL